MKSRSVGGGERRTLLAIATAVILAATAMMSAITVAGPLGTKNRLPTICTSEAMTDQLVCAAYISGFVDGAATEQRLNAVQGLWCIPKEVPSARVVEVVRNHLHAQGRPGEERLDETMVASALIDSWPCKLGLQTAK